MKWMQKSNSKINFFYKKFYCLIHSTKADANGEYDNLPSIYQER